MFTISIGTTLTGTEITLNPYAQSMEEIAPVFKNFSELDLFDAVMAIEYLMLAAKRDEDVNPEWEKTLKEHYNSLLNNISTELIIEYKIALDLSNAFKARDYGKHRVYEKFRTL